MSTEPSALGFHARDGWYFRREQDGSVTVHAGIASVSTRITLDASVRASVVASVSSAGGTSETYRAAADLHGGQ